MDDQTLQRFLKNVNMNGPTRPGMDSPCWPWTAGPTIDAAGKLVVDGEQQLVHRLMWAHAKGITLDFNKDKRYVRHTCGATNCVNPAHLHMPEVVGPYQYKPKRKAQPKPGMTPQQKHVKRAGEREDRRTAFRIFKEHGIPIADTMETLTRKRAAEFKLRPKRGPKVLKYAEGTAVTHTRGMNKAVLLMLRQADWPQRRLDAARALPPLLAAYRLPHMGNPWIVPHYWQWRYKITKALRYRRDIERAKPVANVPLQFELEVILRVLAKSTSHQAAAMMYTPWQLDIWRKEEACARDALAACDAGE
jgi:hypothetical protein